MTAAPARGRPADGSTSLGTDPDSRYYADSRDVTDAWSAPKNRYAFEQEARGGEGDRRLLRRVLPPVGAHGPSDEERVQRPGLRSLRAGFRAAFVGERIQLAVAPLSRLRPTAADSRQRPVGLFSQVRAPHTPPSRTSTDELPPVRRDLRPDTLGRDDVLEPVPSGEAPQTNQSDEGLGRARHLPAHGHDSSGRSWTSWERDGRTYTWPTR
jgi:hypothetical protein